MIAALPTFRGKQCNLGQWMAMVCFVTVTFRLEPIAHDRLNYKSRSYHVSRNEFAISYFPIRNHALFRFIKRFFCASMNYMGQSLALPILVLHFNIFFFTNMFCQQARSIFVLFSARLVLRPPQNRAAVVQNRVTHVSNKICRC